jgi:3'(2'), 5'-bisphosphate nucleotidase
MLQSTLRYAGEAILEVYRSPDFGTKLKSDNSPITIADEQSHEILIEGLGKASPGIPVVSEEDDGSDAAAIQRVESSEWVWLVDPLDGTKGFVNQSNEFCICVGLVHNGVPHSGFLYDPVTQVVHWGIQNEGCFRKKGSITEKLTVSSASSPQNIFMSKLHKGSEADTVATIWPKAKQHQLSSALKFTRIADRSAEVYVRLKPTCLWDTAAGQAVVEAAGGVVLQLNGEPLHCRLGSLINPGFVVASNRVLAEAFISRHNESLD